MKHELSKHAYFDQLTDDQLDRVMQNARRLSLTDGEILFRQGDVTDRCYLLLKGHIKLFRISPDGNEKVIEVIDPGHTYGVALMFLEQSEYPLIAESLGATELISVSTAVFLSVLRESVDLCFLILEDISSRIQGMTDDICDLYLSSATCRVASYLSTKSPSNSNEYQLRIPKSVLASRLSIKPETFSRIIKGLKSDGVLEITGRRVFIKNRMKLENMADLCCARQ
jgi:CRP-like cAMP-binding protein